MKHFHFFCYIQKKKAGYLLLLFHSLGPEKTRTRNKQHDTHAETVGVQHCFCLCLLNFSGSKSAKTSVANAFFTICLPFRNALNKTLQFGVGKVIK